jgi:hypothetical protein
MVTIPPHVAAALDALAAVFGDLTNVVIEPMAPRDHCYCHDLYRADGPCGWCDGPDREVAS